MESKTAKISRVLCSPEIGRIINNNIKNSHQRFTDYIQLWLKKDTVDGQLILNPCVAFNLFNHEGLHEAKAKVEQMRLETDDHDSRSKYNDLIERLADELVNYSDMDIFKV